MKKSVELILISLFVFVTGSKAQSFQSADTIKPPANLENLYSKPLYSDSLVSSFVIFIKKEVKKHKHITHAEHVYVLEGEGEMLLGDKTISVKKGDVVFIPKNTVHSLKVTSYKPVKVISVQAPYYDGKDRVMVE